MQVATLAEVVLNARRDNGVWSVEEIRRQLSREGLEELARAASRLARRVTLARAELTDPREHPWF